MVDRRVVIGKKADGVHYGLRTSFPGYDALTETNDFNITFDSDWTDIVTPYVIGVAAWNLNAYPVGGGGSGFISGFYVSWPSLGYRPFVEIRRVSGTTVYDDYFDSTLKNGAYYMFENAFSFKIACANTPDKLIYAVYPIACPSG